MGSNLKRLNNYIQWTSSHPCTLVSLKLRSSSWPLCLSVSDLERLQKYLKQYASGVPQFNRNLYNSLAFCHLARQLLFFATCFFKKMNLNQVHQTPSVCFFAQSDTNNCNKSNDVVQAELLFFATCFFKKN